ncbi:uncharacterized protein LOC110697696 [Chenopodium quinoa]|uniref:uncharacterized protein LOC110697696 n=1 Tax=Chenopodium quinoa TaxID=63459 RepID=UPI000B774CD3|nr:uncharacterized protein LOC110697696 [Chenopodium quinoa]
MADRRRIRLTFGGRGGGVSGGEPIEGSGPRHARSRRLNASVRRELCGAGPSHAPFQHEQQYGTAGAWSGSTSHRGAPPCIRLLECLHQLRMRMKIEEVNLLEMHSTTLRITVLCIGVTMGDMLAVVNQVKLLPARQSHGWCRSRCQVGLRMVPLFRVLGVTYLPTYGVGRSETCCGV